MKKILYNSVIMLLIFLQAQNAGAQATCDTINEALSEKFRLLGDWEPNGQANYLEEEIDSIPKSLIDFITGTLVEHVSIIRPGNDLFKPDAQLNTVLTDTAKVYLTYVYEEAGFRNTLGYYTYPKGSPPATVDDIDSLVVLFPVVTEAAYGGILSRGEKVYLGEFPPNTVIGYFIISDGWTGDTICYSRQLVFSDKHLNTYTDETSQQQTILLQNPNENRILLGFEDLLRPDSDNDFNDVLFSITADPFAIDTTNIFKVPAAVVSGDTILCDENASALVRVDMEGSGPWAISYSNGTDTVVVENIESTPYEFETLLRDTIRLVSVRNNSTYGIPGGSAVIVVAPTPVAAIDEDAFVCEGENSGSIEVSLEGTAPWNIVYSDGTQEVTINDIQENTYFIDAALDQTFTLISVQDRYCSNDASGSVTLEAKERPTVKLNGATTICDPTNIATLESELTGIAPWTVVLEHNSIIDTVVIDEVNTEIQVREPGTYRIVYFADAYCSGDVANVSIIEVTTPELPSATVSNSAQICGNETGSISINLTGLAPWTFSYTDGTSEYTVSTSDSLYVIEDLPEGSYELISVEDDFCEGNVSGSVEIINRPLPSANLQGDGFICEGGSSELLVTLTGTSPWTVIYSDGSMEEAITTDQAEYGLSINAPGSYTLVSVEDAYCDGSVSGLVEVVTKELPSATISGTGEVCSEEETTDINLEFTGESPWTIVYTNGEEEFELTTDSNPMILSVTGSGFFELVSVQDAYCPGIVEGAAEVINVLEELNVELSNDDFVCFGENINLSLSGDLDNISSIPSTDGMGTLVSISEYEFEYQPADGESGIITFSIELTNACGSKIITREVEIEEELKTSFTTSPAGDVTTDSPITFIPDEDTADSYYWEFGDGNTSTDEIPVHEYVQGGSYDVKLTVEKNGCENSGSMDLEVTGNKLLYVPNVFNPRAVHQENQVVKVYGTSVSENGFHFRIVNRWGKTMYQTGSFVEANSNGWAGHNAYNNEEQSLNVFTYILRGQFEDGEQFEHTGTVTLIQ